MDEQLEQAHGNFTGELTTSFKDARPATVMTVCVHVKRSAVSTTGYEVNPSGKRLLAPGCTRDKAIKA
jgi:hypothetical protein